MQFIRRPEITAAAQFARPDRLEIRPSPRLGENTPGGTTLSPARLNNEGKFLPPTTLNYGFRSVKELRRKNIVLVRYLKLSTLYSILVVKTVFVVRPVTPSTGEQLRRQKEDLPRFSLKSKHPKIQPVKFRLGSQQNTFDREFNKIRDSFEARKADSILERLTSFFQPISRLMGQWK